MAIDALSGEFTWTVDQVGAQALPIHFTADTDISGWTFAAKVRTGLADDTVDVDVCTITVDVATTVTVNGTTGNGTTGFGCLRITADDAEQLQTGHWFEVVRTDVEQPLLRGQLQVRRRVIP